MSERDSGVSRRRFLKKVSAGVVGAAAAPAALLESPETSAAPNSTNPPAGTAAIDSMGRVPVTLHVNGKNHQLQIEPRTTLADALRYHLGLTGTKIVCDRGSCGACTVIAGGKTVYSCMMLAVDAQNKPIRTVEGLAPEGHLTPLQDAFVQRDALMCGFCTPGFVMSCTALLERNPHPTREQVQDALRGNLCRCGTYPRIFEACMEATGGHKAV